MTLRDAALWYAENGFPVFPCHPRGKKPITKHGFQDATTDKKQIVAWWLGTPKANIGIPTGPESGLLLFDIDLQHGGQDSLDSLIAKFGRWPNTAEAITGGGGRHILFRHVDGLQCSAGQIGAGLDIKTTGGYFIAVPSVHPSGNCYDWDGVDGANAILKLCDPPGWLVKLARDRRNGQWKTAGNGSVAKIPQGRRNEELASFGGGLRARGMDAEEIVAALQLRNTRRCDPPLPEAEVRQIAESVARYDPRNKSDDPTAARQFEALADGRYILRVPGIGAEIEVDRLRRDRHELQGELAVRCHLPGAKSYDGTVSIADFNLSSARARTERAKLIAQRSRADQIDWAGILEEFVQRVLSAERAGQPAVDLRDLPKPERDEIHVEGFTFPRRHPSIIFGDGGSAKSYTALFLAGRLAEQGHSVALFDWELAGDDHRERLELLFGADMPRISYARCDRPLTVETDRLRRIVRDHAIEYAIFDSIAFACDGPPESAEVAGRYFRAVREIGIGSLHVAHVTKSDDNDKRPFGSAFWHNGARCTWFCKAAETAGNDTALEVGFFNRKANLGPIKPPLGFTITFTEIETAYRRSSVGDTPDLAVRMNTAQRIAHLLKAGQLPMKDIAETLDIPLNTVTQTVNRYAKKGRTFVILEGKRVGLKG